jgi:hypothetical protein
VGAQGIIVITYSTGAAPVSSSGFFLLMQ